MRFLHPTGFVDGQGGRLHRRSIDQQGDRLRLARGEGDVADRPGLQDATEEPSVPATRASSFGLGPRAMGRLDEVDESDSPMRRGSRDLLLSDYID
jgi:hypothetical protein